MPQFLKFIAVFAAGILTSILTIGYVSDTRQSVTVEDCKAMGQFRFKTEVFDCSLRTQQPKEHT